MLIANPFNPANPLFFTSSASTVFPEEPLLDAPVVNPNLREEMPMSDDIFDALGLTPSDVPSLPTQARRRLTAYLLRWGHFDAARRSRFRRGL